MRLLTETLSVLVIGAAIAAANIGPYNVVMS